jgi:hypothetical protein
MKSTMAGNDSFRRPQRTEPQSYRSFDGRLQGSICGHELLPILSHDLGSDEIQGWECIFCNERFENYSAGRQNEDVPSVYAT